MAEQGREWQEYVEAGVDAVESMTVPELFGQGVTNPLLAGLGDTFLDEIGGDLSDQERQRLEDAIGLRTGAQTQEGITWRDEGLAALREIYSQYGEDAVAEALAAYAEGAQEARVNNQALPDPLLGMGYFEGPDGPVPISRMMEALPPGFGTGGVRWPGETLPGGAMPGDGAALDPLSTMNQQADDLSTKLGGISDQLSLLPGAVAPTTTELGLSVETAGGLKSALDGITGQTWKIRLDWEAMNMSNVPPLMREVIAQEVAKVVRANGGTSPGTDPRRNRTSN
jgi:hypothetical protein